ncbi:amidohydrolase [Aquimarina sp. 2201CG5-10]|uniref:amidohydrolase n=1 Tax=Aquimarina callyspongiae TaxID=3098150 RepID=UPI002AB5641C|nr:amidohydrolase [Aquimarina sp. 2201CG5-10]MDY8135927.1 amidohydrolase [Aquimarina sp. 2201CG5-10]
MKYMTSLLIFFSFLCITSSCDNDDDKETIQSSQTVYYNGKIYTVNPEEAWAEAVVVNDSKITFVGSTIEAFNFADAGAKQIDLEGALMLPGIHDVHMHPLEASSTNFKFTLDDTETNPENYITSIKAASNQNPGNDWLLGYGHSLFSLLESARLPIEILDDVSTTRPIAIMEQTSHSIWCNSKALEVLGINNSTPNPQGGAYLKNEAGNLTGILLDNAGEIVLEQALAPTITKLENDYQGLIQYGLPELAKHGITSIAEARTYWKRKYHEVWQRIEREGRLTARVNLGLWIYPKDNDIDQIASIKALYSNKLDKLLKISQIKLYSDGIIPNTTAALETDYLFDIIGANTNNGLNYITQDRIASLIRELEPIGFDFHIHAIGNRGITETLNAIEQSGTIAGRHRITHLEVMSPSDYSRFSQLNVTADCQVAGDFTNPSNWSELNEIIGSEHSQHVVPLKSLTDANARLTLSSDWDVSTLNPFVGIQNAVTRAPENITLEQAIAGYTINGAYTMRQEDKVGSIEVGKQADLIVLNQDIFTISPNQIKNTKVDLTIFNGEIIYRR